jgi:DNA-binding CsgD family transcriptional regulator
MRKALFFLLWVNIFFVNAQQIQQTQQLRDSIKKYQFLDPNLAIKYGLEYIEIRSEDPPDIEMTSMYGKVGEILYYMELHSSALEYFNKAIRLKDAVKDLGPEDKKMRHSPWLVLNIGNIYFANKNLSKAKEKFLEAKKLFKTAFNPNSIQSKRGVNTANSNIGLVYGIQGDHDKQEELYQKVYESRVSLGFKHEILYSMSQLLLLKLKKNELLAADNQLQEINRFYSDHKKSTEDLSTSLLTRNYGYTFFYLGAFYQGKKKYSKAIEYLEIARSIFKEFPIEMNLLGSRLAECYLAIGKTELAEEIALDNLKFKNLSNREKTYNYKVLEKVYKQRQESEDLLRIKDSLILIASGTYNSKVLKNLNDLETQIILSDSARALNESKIRYNTYLYILIIGSVILFFSLVTIRINYNYQKEKGMRLEIENANVLEELSQKNRELVSKANFIIQRNDYLKNLQKKIESKESEEELSKKSLSKELNRMISSEKSYEEFDNLFVNVYPDFYQKLNQISKLSQTDLRLASYIKMNHNNNEIANISGISLRTVESQRYRLTKKLNLDKNQDLNSFLLSI